MFEQKSSTGPCPGRMIRRTGGAHIWHREHGNSGPAIYRGQKRMVERELVPIHRHLYAMADFIELKLSDDVWLSACGKCREVVAFAANVEALHDAESGHECSDPNEQIAEPADVA